MKIQFLIIPICFLLMGCAADSGADKCKYGTPVAIFAANTPTVVQHQFSAKGQEGNEQVVFENGIQLEIFQSGCNSVKQVFTYTLPPFPEGEPNWFFISAGLLKRYGDLGDQFAPLVLWGNAIEQKMTSFKLGEPLELESGHFAKINRTQFPEKSILEIELSEGQE